MTRVRRIEQFDGLRAVAVLAVMAAHTNRPIGIGGGFGVDVFFVLSGFLITGVLYGEWEERRTISLPRFYARRALRLYPALIALVVVLTPFGIELSKRESWLSWGEAVGIAVTYTSNLAVLISDTQVTGALGHTWSLAVEEQFYLLWPVLLVVLLRRDLRPRVLVATVGLIGVACLSLFLLLSARVPETIRRGAVVLPAGCSLRRVAARCGARPRAGQRERPALAWRPSAADRPGASRLGGVPARARVDVSPNAASHTVGRGVLAGDRGATSHERQRPHLARSERRSLPAIGRISYALYLWHLPIFALVRPGTFGLADWTQDPVRVSLTFVAAALSYRFVERPFLKRKNRLRSTPVAGFVGEAQRS